AQERCVVGGQGTAQRSLGARDRLRRRGGAGADQTRRQARDGGAKAVEEGRLSRRRAPATGQRPFPPAARLLSDQPRRQRAASRRQRRAETRRDTTAL